MEYYSAIIKYVYINYGIIYIVLKYRLLLLNMG